MAVVLSCDYSGKCRIWSSHSNDLKSSIFREIMRENSRPRFDSRTVSKVLFLVSHLELKNHSRSRPCIMLNYAHNFISNKFIFCSSIIVNNLCTELHWTNYKHEISLVYRQPGAACWSYPSLQMPMWVSRWRGPAPLGLDPLPLALYCTQPAAELE